MSVRTVNSVNQPLRFSYMLLRSVMSRFAINRFQDQTILLISSAVLHVWRYLIDLKRPQWQRAVRTNKNLWKMARPTVSANLAASKPTWCPAADQNPLFSFSTRARSAAADASLCDRFSADLPSEFKGREEVDLANAAAAAVHLCYLP
jgi:hypothetical protein